MFEVLQEIDSVRLNLGQGSSLVLNLTIAFIMFGVALELTLGDFKKLMNHPKPAFIGILSQFLVLPLLTFLLVSLMGKSITPTVGLGMIMVAACPGGNLSNFFSSLARGNTALSVSLTAFTTIGGLILTPFNFTFWGSLYIRFYDVSNGSEYLKDLVVDPFSVLQTILTILGIPLLIGMFINYRFQNFSLRVQVPIKRLSIAIFFALVGVMFYMNIDYFIQYIYYIFIIVLGHNALALSSGYYLAKWTGLNVQNRKTIAIETGIQNSALAIALLINPNIFPASMPIGGMLFIAAWWGVWHIISGLTIAGFWSGFSLKARSHSVEV